jgi:outer membrane autotransporter protein
MRCLGWVGFLSLLTAIATEAVAGCEQSGSSVRCNIDGATSGQLYSPASKIVRQTLVLSRARERQAPEPLLAPDDISSFAPGSLWPGEAGATLFDSRVIADTVLEGSPARSPSPRVGRNAVDEESPDSPDQGGLGPIGLFAIGSAGFEDQDSTKREIGQNTDRYGIAVGLDYQFDNALVGFAVDYLRENTDFDSHAGDMQNDEIGVQVFGALYFTPQAYAIIGGRFADNDYDLSRRFFVDFNQDLDPDEVDHFEKAKADTDGIKYSVVAGGGYEFPLGGGFEGGLAASLEFERTEIDGYSEKNADPTGSFRYDDDDIETLTSTLEGRLQKTFYSGSVAVVPVVYLRYLHEFADDSRTIEATVRESVSGLPGEDEVKFRTNNPDRNYFSVGGGVFTDFGVGLSAFASFDVLFGHSYRNEQTVNVGVRGTF